MGRKKKSIWTQERLDTLYECWKNGNTTKERIPLVEGELSDVPLPTAISMMRKLARTETKWISWATRKENEKERARVEKHKEKERKLQERIQKREDRANRREAREQRLKDREVRKDLDSSLNETHSDAIREQIDPEFKFCPDVQQFVNNNSCIFRVFDKNFPKNGACCKCRRMDKYIPIIKEVVKNGRQKKRSAGNKARKGSEDKA